tara:strand:- start:1034 stop:1636 length:603 start_codon:yes stop_codon:yes gene_type:complete
VEQSLTSEWGILVIILLRLTSIIIPVIPGTPFLLISGYLFGFVNGLLISCISDLIACSLCFSISRLYGRKIIQKIMPKRFLNKFESLSKNYLERNFFLLTGCLMTSWFDFVSYGVGLTKLKWRTFFCALLLSVFLSDLPFVATGSGIRELKDQNISIKQIINGDFPSLDQKSLIVFIFSALIIFSIGIIRYFLNKKIIKK